MAGHKLSALNFFASPAATQRRLGDRLRRQRLQKGHEIEHQTLSWLRCDLDAKGTHVRTVDPYSSDLTLSA